MNGQRLVALAACASKSNHEAKRAEAHARASRVYAKKAEKDAKDAQVAANQLLQFSKNFLAQIFYSYDKTEAIVSREDLDALIKIANVSDHVIEADTLQALLNCEKLGFETSKDETKLMLNANQMNAVERKMEDKKISKSFSDPGEMERTEKEYPNESCPENCNLPGCLMNFTLPAINTATKRKVKQQKKGRATGISPLLSKEEISIVKRATSPSTSQHSGLSSHLQHKYSVRMKRSTSSLHSTPDDDDKIMTTPTCDNVKEPDCHSDGNRHPNVT